MKKPLGLVVEDDDTLSELFALALQQVGFDTITILDGQQALDQLHAIVPDLVVLDLHLPNVSGETILKYIRADERLKQVRVILASADMDEGKRLADLADAFLLKPIMLAQLRETVQDLR